MSARAVTVQFLPEFPDITVLSSPVTQDEQEELNFDQPQRRDC